MAADRENGSITSVQSELASGTWDGKASIEHQIDIHLDDLLQTDNNSLPAPVDILQGLCYVMDYRIRSNKQPHLDREICKRLAHALLQLSSHRRTFGILPQLGARRLSGESQTAFCLFADFLNEVVEFREAVGDIPVDVLRRHLLLHTRICAPDSPHIYEASMAVLKILTRTFPQFQDWQEFFKPEDVGEVALVLKNSVVFQDKAISMPALPAKPFPPEMLFFDRKVSRVCDMFGTSVEQGLSDEQIRKHRKHYGPNVLPEPKSKPLWRMLWDQTSDFMVGILAAAMLASAVVDYPNVASSVVLGVVIVLNITIGLLQEWKAARTIRSLRSFAVPKARVIRNHGREAIVEAHELVPGDVVVLGEGDLVPADLRLAQATSLKAIESNLTGESEPVPKQTAPIRVKTRKLPIAKCHGNLFMSTVVARGSALGIVVRTGHQTEIGKINAALSGASKADPKSPLQKRLGRLGKILVVVAFGLCALVAVVGIAQGRDGAEMIRMAVSLAVSAIPEGLVAVVTVTMAIGIGQLAKQNAVVRKLSAVETLGSVTTICTDKTGTLTEGRMQFQQMTTSDKFANRPAGLVEQACWSVCFYCNNACFSCPDPKSKPEYIGDPTEIALLEASLERGQSLEACPSSLRMLEIPFDSDRRSMTVVLDAKHVNPLLLQSDPTALGWAFSKGAPEVLLSRCSHWASDSDDGGGHLNTFAIDDGYLSWIAAKENEMSGAGLRVLALAVRPIRDFYLLDYIKTQPDTQDLIKVECNLCFVGLVGLLDPPRPGVVEAVQQCFQAGIKVCMVTGDHIRTAINIAERIGIYESTKNRAIRGGDLDLLSDEAIAQMRPFPAVFARASPQNKLSIVRALQLRNEIVIMTGDGVNDAPALKMADVGIAMGLTGTEISREAADIVLLDDNFQTIVRAIYGGRLVYANINKFIVYLLACNSAEIWTVLFALILRVPPPFSAINILWANIIADVPPSMSLGCEPAETDLLRQRPREKDEPVLVAKKWLLLICEGLVLSGLTLAVYIYRYRHGQGDQLIFWRSEALFVLTGLQLGLAFLSRSTTLSIFKIGLLGNKYMIASVFLSFGLLVAGHYIPGLNTFLELAPLSGSSWIILLVSFFILFICTEFFKVLFRVASHLSHYRLSHYRLSHCN